MELAENLKPIDIEEIKLEAKRCKGRLDNIFLHWTAGRYGQRYDDYHLSIDYDGRIYAPGNNLNFLKHKSHTWMRNGGSIGIAMCGCYDAEANSGYNSYFGSQGPTTAQIEAMAVLVAVICKYAGLNISDALTHCEIAFIDGYGPGSGDPQTKWDLWFLPDVSCDDQMKPGGDVIRGKAQWYYDKY